MLCICYYIIVFVGGSTLPKTFAFRLPSKPLLTLKRFFFSSSPRLFLPPSLYKMARQQEMLHKLMTGIAPVVHEVAATSKDTRLQIMALTKFVQQVSATASMKARGMNIGMTANPSHVGYGNATNGARNGARNAGNVALTVRDRDEKRV